VSEENVATVRLILESVSKDLLEAFADAPRLRAAFLHYFAEDLEWVMPTGFEADAPNESHWGVDGAIAALTDHLSPWAEYRNVVEHYIDAGDSVVALTHEYGHALNGATDIDLEVGMVWKFSAGKIARVVTFTGHEQALRAAGVDPTAVAPGA
jgi:ketosteroid isomerase-like protein